MSGADDARALLEAVGGYVETPPGAAPPSQDRPVRLATVAPGYSGTGPVPVIFDGEALAGLRQYVPLAPVASGQRVALLPVGATYVVLGRVDGPTIGSTAGPGFLELATDAETFAFTRPDAAVSPASLGKVLLPLIGQRPTSVVVGSGSATVADDGTVTFSGVTSLQLRGVFDGLGAGLYQIVIHSDHSGLAYHWLRFGLNGTFDAASNYEQGYWQSASAGGATGNAAQTIFSPAGSGGATDVSSWGIFGNIDKATRAWGLGYAVTGMSDWSMRNSKYRHNNLTALNDLQVGAISGTMSGIVKVVKLA